MKKMTEKEKKEVENINMLAREWLNDLIDSLKELDDLLKNGADYQLKCLNFIRAQAIKLCLEEYDFHFDCLIEKFENKGWIKKT